jgi:quinol monooxygenase YgiN
VSYYAFALRRVRPGRFESYCRTATEIAEGWARARGQLSYRLCVAEDDPDCVLLVGEWPSPDDLDAAFGSLPPDLLRAVAADTASVESGWCWYRPDHSMGWIDEPAGSLVVSRFEIRPEDAAPFDRWVREHHRAVSKRPGVVSQVHLIGLDRGTMRADLGEYAGAEARRAAAEMLERRPPPTRLLGVTSFVGRLGYCWEPSIG